MKQNGLTTIADIKPGREQNLSNVLNQINANPVSNGLINLTALTTVHYVSWVILPELPDRPARLLFETHYDGELDAHLDELLEHGLKAFETIYADCGDYPAPGAPSYKVKLKQLLVAGQISPSAYYIAFPGRGVADILNAIEVNKEAQRFINSELRKPYSYIDPDGQHQTTPSGLEQLTPNQLQERLVRHFRNPKTDVSPRAPLPSHLLILIFNWLFVLTWGLFEVPVLMLLAFFCERAEARNPDTKLDPTRRRADPALYRSLDTGLQNHLCTFKTVKRTPRRLYILRRVLSIVDFAARKIFIFSRLGQLSTIHFAKWMVIDGDGPRGRDRRLLFESNYDGSFNNYLGDFSDLAWYGLNPIWSNTIGFPLTRWLFLRGAKDIDRFVDTDREHFYPAQVFYGPYTSYPVRNLRSYLDFSDDLAAKIAAAERKERRKLRALERIERHGKRSVDRRDLQGIVASGYQHYHHARYIFLSIVDSGGARTWLNRIVGNVTTAERFERAAMAAKTTHLNLAFTSAGLKAIGLPDAALEQFPYAFVGGMDRPEAAQILGDTGHSAREEWQFGNSAAKKTRPLHLMLLLFARTAGQLAILEDNLLMKPSPFEVIASIDSYSPDRNEPFGFRDGLSQPSVMSLTNSVPERIDEVVRPGEFVLGYENEHGTIARAPSVASALDPQNILPPDSDNPTTHKAFGLNGSFLVARKLAQDVEGFWRFAANESARPGGAPDPERRELLAAKMMGRWRSGAPLLLAKDRDVPAFAEAPLANDFLYGRIDPDGLRCPIGSHIRRAYPRDGLKLRTPPPLLPPTTAKLLQLTKTHRIIRRGRKYREVMHDATAIDQSVPKYEDGILFIALNTDLQRQFEFIQETWLDNPAFQGLDNDKDPVSGDNDGGSDFTIQALPCDQRIKGLQRFVKVKGGGYFFLPGIRALQFLANLK
jgi:Dyp-type peroxidase family